jgi:ubiquinone/menaquinone biosynthesis C-methylase UbiE
MGSIDVEYHIPINKTDYLSIQHVERYRYAVSRLLPGMKVLDIACGAGYGTAMLLRHGCDVTGVDYGDDLWQQARRIWGHEGFVKGNALELPFEGASFDGVVSFETIEHVVDGDRFLREMHRVLRPGGIFICSTPNIHYTAHPPYHAKEYEPEEFYFLIRQRFVQVECYGQYFKATDRLRDLVLYATESLLSKLGVKAMLISLFRKKEASIGSKVKGDSVDSWISHSLEGQGNINYKVNPLLDTKLLRIMVAVAKKEVVA